MEFPDALYAATQVDDDTPAGPSPDSSLQELSPIVRQLFESDAEDGAGGGGVVAADGDDVSGGAGRDDAPAEDVPPSPKTKGKRKKVGNGSPKKKAQAQANTTTKK